MICALLYPMQTYCSPTDHSHQVKENSSTQQLTHLF
jgi:hypothetical protein